MQRNTQPNGGFSRHVAISMPGVLIAVVGDLGRFVDAHKAGMLGVAAGDRMILDLAKMAGEGDMLGPGDALVSEEEHLVLQQQRPDLGHQPGIPHGGAQVRVAHFGAYRASERVDLRGRVLGGDRDKGGGRHCGDPPSVGSLRVLRGLGGTGRCA